MKMRLFPAIALVAMVVACDRAAKPATEAAPEPAPVLEPSPEPLDEAGLRAVCQAVLAAVNELPAGLIEAEGGSGGIANLSWRAPVDGGRAHAQCRVTGDVAEWRLANLPGGEDAWRTGAADPIIRYVREGERITVIQTFPDGTSARTSVSATVEEAR